MVGLGCGARSYTWACHYSSEYAVSRGGVRAILDDYVGRPTETFDFAHHGFVLDLEEQCRRYILKSLLRREGLALDRYRALFGVDALDSVPEMAELIPQELAVLTEDGKRLQLTEAGLERTDALGPWLYSARVRDLIASHTLR